MDCGLDGIKNLNCTLDKLFNRYNEKFNLPKLKKRSCIHRIRSAQTVEKVQQKLGFLLYMWYNVYGDENVRRKENRKQ